MKKITLLFFLSVMALAVQAQAPEAARWKSTVRMSSADEGVVVMTMTVNPGWHVYAPGIPKGGPIAMTFDFSSSVGVQFVGNPVPSVAPLETEDAVFGMTVKYWAKTVKFEQRFKVVDSKTAKIDGVVRFQGCNDETCSPPKKVKIAPVIPSAEVK